MREDPDFTSLALAALNTFAPHSGVRSRRALDALSTTYSLYCRRYDPRLGAKSTFIYTTIHARLRSPFEGDTWRSEVTKSHIDNRLGTLLPIISQAGLSMADATTTLSSYLRVPREIIAPLRRCVRDASVHPDDLLAPHVPVLDQLEFEDDLVRAIATLTAREREILELRINSVPLRLAGDHLGITGERVRQIYALATAKMREYMPAAPQISGHTRPVIADIVILYITDPRLVDIKSLTWLTRKTLITVGADRANCSIIRPACHSVTRFIPMSGDRYRSVMLRAQAVFSIGPHPRVPRDRQFDRLDTDTRELIAYEAQVDTDLFFTLPGHCQEAINRWRTRDPVMRRRLEFHHGKDQDLRHAAEEVRPNLI